MGGAKGLGMDAIVFGVKRANAVLQHRLVGAMLKSCALTPARFDLMFVTFRNGPMSQRQLRSALGVSRPTVSRMLSALERLHFVARSAFTRGRTRVSVALTDLGRAVLRHAVHRLMRKRVVRRTLDRLFDFTARCDFESYCGMVRRALRDSAYDFYPWHPDD